MHFHRLGGRVLQAALLGVLAMAAAPAAAMAADTVRVGLSQPTFSFIPLDIALAQKMCTQRGLDVQKAVFNGGAHLHQAIAAGSIDVGLGAGPEFGFLAKGAPEKAVAAMADAPRDLALAVAKNGPIKTAADLKSKRISVSTRGSLTYWAARELMRKEGWEPSDLEIVPLGSFSAQTAALKLHEVDGMLVEASTAGRAEEEGLSRTLLNFGDIVPFFHIHVIFASNDFIAKHPQDLKGFLACLFEGIHYMRAHKAESVKVASAVLDLSPSLAAKLYDQITPMYNLTGRFDPRALAELAQATVDMGEVKDKPDMSKLYTEQFLPPAQ